MFGFLHCDGRHVVLSELGEVFCHHKQGLLCWPRDWSLNTGENSWTAHTKNRERAAEAYQNADDFLRFLVIHRDSVDLLQFIPNMNQSCQTHTIFYYSDVLIQVSYSLKSPVLIKPRDVYSTLHYCLS